MTARHTAPVRATFPADPPTVMVTISLRLLHGDLFAATDVAVYAPGPPGKDETQAVIGRALREPVRAAIRALVETLGGDLHGFQPTGPA